MMDMTDPHFSPVCPVFSKKEKAMTQLQIAWLALFTVGGAGVCLIAGSFLIKSLAKNALPPAPAALWAP